MNTEQWYSSLVEGFIFQRKLLLRKDKNWQDLLQCSTLISLPASNSWINYTVTYCHLHNNSHTVFIDDMVDIEMHLNTLFVYFGGF